MTWGMVMFISQNGPGCAPRSWPVWKLKRRSHHRRSWGKPRTSLWALNVMENGDLTEVKWGSKQEPLGDKKHDLTNKKWGFNMIYVINNLGELTN